PTSPRATSIPPLLPLLSSIHTAPPNIYPLSLHDALPISTPASARASRSSSCSAWPSRSCRRPWPSSGPRSPTCSSSPGTRACSRSEEHTSELQSLTNLVCRLLLEKKKKHNVLNPHLPNRR